MAAAHARRDVRRAADGAGVLPAAVLGRQPQPPAVAADHGVRGRRVPRPRRGGRPQADPVAHPLWRRREPQGGRHRRAATLLVLAHEVPALADLHPDRAGDPRALPAAVRVRRDQRAVLQPAARAADALPLLGAAAARARVHPAAAAVLRQLRDLLRAVPVLRRAPDPRLRARRRELGREDRRRPRASRGEGGDHARDQPLAVRRGVREGRRQARARAALPRRPGHRQDDDLEGDRDELQLPVRDDSRVRIRRHVHRHGRDHGPVPGPQGAQAREEVGRAVHRVHRRDRRGRDAAGVARRRPLDDRIDDRDGIAARLSASSGPTAR